MAQITIAQTRVFLSEVYHDYRPRHSNAQTSPAANTHYHFNSRPYVQPHFIPAPIIINGGGCGGSSGRHVQIVASNPQTIRELRNCELQDQHNSSGTAAAVAGGIGTILFAAGAAFVGKMLVDNSKKLNQAIQFRDETLPQMDQQIQQRLRPIISKHIENLESKSFWSKMFVAVTVGALACAVTAFVAGMFTLPWLITAAVIGGVLIAATGAFCGVWYFLQDYSLPPEMVRELETHLN